MKVCDFLCVLSPFSAKKKYLQTESHGEHICYKYIGAF